MRTAPFLVTGVVLRYYGSRSATKQWRVRCRLCIILSWGGPVVARGGCRCGLLLSLPGFFLCTPLSLHFIYSPPSSPACAAETY